MKKNNYLWLSIIATMCITIAILLKNSNNDIIKFSIEYPLINDIYNFKSITYEDNLVKDTTIINCVKSLFEKDSYQNPKYYGNWWSYYYINQSKDTILVLRVDEDKIYDEILIIRNLKNDTLESYHVAREYYDGYDYGVLNSELHQNKLKKNLKLGYFDDSGLKNTIILDTIIYQSICSF